ncbi:MAG: hypothetical protein KIS76_03900 [Pyrinomonadaceae bacterium]|nr:hypothetical protein [Pyrinomonadaceae bacterium]
MPRTYGQEAIEKCRALYCRFGGKNFDAIEREMRKEYPGWRKQNLIDRRGRLGWIANYGFQNSLKIHLQKLTESVNDDEQDLYISIREMRKASQLKAMGKNATRDEVYQYRDFCKLEIEARRNLDLSRDNFETFVSGYEKLLGWLSELDAEAAAALVKHGEKLAELAEAHYGKEETGGGAKPGTDEGGE